MVSTFYAKCSAAVEKSDDDFQPLVRCSSHKSSKNQNLTRVLTKFSPYQNLTSIIWLGDEKYDDVFNGRLKIFPYAFCVRCQSELEESRRLLAHVSI